MSIETITATLLIVTVFVLIFYDIWAKAKQRDGKATISWVVLTAAKSWPIISLAIGVLLGHLFWQNCLVP